MAVLSDVILAVAPAGAAVASMTAWHFRRAAVRANTDLQQTRKQNAVLGLQIESRDQEVAHFATVRLPSLTAAPSGNPAQAGALRHPNLATTDFGRSLQAALRHSADFVTDFRARTEASANAQIQALFAPLTAQAAVQQSAMVQLLRRAGDEEVLQHAFAVDHGVTLLVQRMQIIGALAGREVSSRRPDAVLMEVLIGAQSRVQDYTRVKVTNRSSVLVKGPAVDPPVVALGALVDNGCRHSSPASTVAVWSMPVQGGINIFVDSVGPMRDPGGYAHAAAVLPGQQRVLLTSLGAQLGLAAVGVLARRSGFQAWLDPRQQDGVRAVLHLPARLLLPEPVADEPQHHDQASEAVIARAGSAGRMAAFSHGARAGGQAGTSGFRGAVGATVDAESTEHGVRSSR
ncbi:hypothetical protein ACFWP3_15165 [Streptomyces sp. NPDC058525]|uniref:hypothetical protein n=1 Tax=Streptomyces sp. NPDC058525 TaxID=3346538 RepID=UPI00366581DB